jgi:hypothetical protein
MRFAARPFSASSPSTHGAIRFMRAEYGLLPHGLSVPIVLILALGSLVAGLPGSVLLSVGAKRLFGTRSRMLLGA